MAIPVRVSGEVAWFLHGAQESNLPSRRHTQNLEAYESYLAGLYLWNQRNDGDLNRSILHFREAIRRDPDYALAHGYAAYCHENLFLRAGRREENRQATIRHAHAALAYGQDDAMALALAGFNIGMIEPDWAAAREAFEAALALSPSSAFTYLCGSSVAWAGEAERAIEWAKRALRLSPFDPWSYFAWSTLSAAFFQQSGYDDAANAARKSIQGNPGFSISHMLLAAALAKLGRIDEAKASAARVIALQPGFRISEWRSAIDPAPALAEPLTEALRAAGLPD